MKKDLEKRIKLANEYIQFAIDNKMVYVWDYFGDSSPVYMTFKKPISVSKTGKVVTVFWDDGFDFVPRKYVGKFYTTNEDDVESLREEISGIIRAIKREARAMGIKLSHK